jgi:hypothetical protein
VLCLKCVFEIDGVRASVHSGRLSVSAPDDNERDAVFLHVLYAAAAGAEMPKTALKESEGRPTVTAGDLSHTFGMERC